MGKDKQVKTQKQYTFTKLGVQVGFIFAVPLVAVFVIGEIFDIRVLYLLPISFVASWVMTFVLYNKTKIHFENNKK